MAQMTIYTKIRHNSKKDITASIGKNNQIYITFRNGSHAKITTTDYVRVTAVNGRVMFSSGVPGQGYKLSTNKTGKTPNYYIKFSGDANPKAAKIIARSLKEDGSVSFDIEELETFAPPSTALQIPAQPQTLEARPYTPPRPMEDLRELFDRVSVLEAKVAQLEARPQVSAPIVDTSKGPNDWPEWKKTLIETINSL